MSAPEHGNPGSAIARENQAVVRDPAGTLAEQAYAEIRRRIIVVEMPPNLGFSETEVAQALAIGKTPVREALARLRLEGLVQVQPRSGYKVADVTLQDANDVCELRALLEGESARTAAEYAQQAAPYLGARDEAAVLEGDASSPARLHAGIESDRTFHLELARVAGNARLTEALERTLLFSVRLAYLALALDPRTTFPVHSHAELISAIADGAGDGARSIVVAEIRDWQARIVDALVSSESVTQASVDVRTSSKFYLDIPKKPG